MLHVTRATKVALAMLVLPVLFLAFSPLTTHAADYTSGGYDYYVTYTPDTPSYTPSSSGNDYYVTYTPDTYTSSGCSSGCGGGSYTPPPEHKSPSCTLSVSRSNITRGETVVLSWTSHNATDASLSSVGYVSLSDSQTLSPTQTITYTLTVINDGKQSTCSKTVTVTIPVAPTCTLSAAPHSIVRGDNVILVWSSSNANAGSINNGVGSVNLSGSRTVYPDTTTTYTATFTTQDGQTVNCSDTVSVNTLPPPPQYNAPSCNIYINNLSTGQAGNNYNYNNNQYGQYNNQPVTIYWTSSNASYGWLNNGIGSISLSGSRAVYPSGNSVYTATFVGQNGQQVNCSVTVNINTYVPPPIYPNPTPYVTLSAVPYTGLDLGVGGTILYWSFLTLWSLFAAYLIAVKRVHMSIYRWYVNTLFGSASVVSTPTEPQHVVQQYSASAPVSASQNDSIDPFIMAQISRGRK